jgi:glyoxylase-like metal-dependent hydrolase (beta-lactamase superfamily II)
LTDDATTLRAAILPVTSFQQNCTLLWDDTTKRGAVVDPGGDVERILGAIADAGLSVERILLTHGHIDHAGGAAELKQALEARHGTPVPVDGPDERDGFLLGDLSRSGGRWGVPDARDIAPDQFLAEGDAVDIGGHRFEVLHCPGHTPGHVAFVNRDVGFALVGDVLFRGSVGRTDFSYGDSRALLRSIREKLLPLGDEIEFVCGHGPGSTFGRERLSNPFLRTRAVR